ncbi:polysaccharide deacetylase family protein [Alteromonas sp. H39]|uniref:polysaccharide deacetylase family protein n=1 Tax=Alteromonas sp. H39 TaxID=3389876 RepID=UPI0039E0C0B2
MKYNMGLRQKIGIAFGLIAAALIPGVSYAQTDDNGMDNAVILLYHHVAENTPASTSISPDTFAEHMEYLANNHTVLGLPEVISALRQGDTLPERTVVITFDDGYDNILTNAHPILKRHGFPYTIFINPEEIGSNRSQLTWEQVETMQNDGVVFANHTLDHLHMLERKPGESESAWLKRVWSNVTEAEDILEEKTGRSLKYLAYPFGEYNLALANKLSQAGYIGFGQHSGGVSSESQFSALPRFPAAGPYANLKTLKTKLESLAMPVSSYTPEDPMISDKGAPPKVTFTVTSEDVDLGRVNCFFGGDTITPRVNKMTATVTLDDALPVGRSRINCTAPSIAKSGRYYWYSQPFFVADSNGKYPD